MEQKMEQKRKRNEKFKSGSQEISSYCFFLNLKGLTVFLPGVFDSSLGIHISP